jgi:cell division protein YceG involved in septum cleavage
MSTKQRIIGLSRFALLLVAIVLAVSFFSGNAQASATGTKAHYEYVTIHNGQSLWDLAERYAGKGVNERDWIASLVELNNLTSNQLQPGQRIALPN